MSNNKRVFLVFSLFVLAGLSPMRASAAIKDSDFDGLSDVAEKTVYMTNPLDPDTDGDGVPDGAEVLAGTNPLDSADSKLALLAKPDPGLLGDPAKFSWYLGRASGMFAFIMLTLTVCFGLLNSSRFMTKLFLPATIYAMHRTLSFAALLAVVTHMSSFFFDRFFHLSFAEALVPFLLSREYQSALGFDIGKGVGIGIIAFYFILLLVLTSEFRSKMSPKLWRGTHYLSFVAYLLFIAHGVSSGTDSKEWWMVALYVASGMLVFGLIIFRVIFRNIMPRVRASQSFQGNAPIVSENFVRH